MSASCSCDWATGDACSLCLPRPGSRPGNDGSADGVSGGFGSAAPTGTATPAEAVSRNATTHVVVPVDPCELFLPGPLMPDWCGRFHSDDRCDGCLGDGRRALLDQAVPVEERDESDPCCADGAYGPCDCTTGWKRTWVEP